MKSYSKLACVTLCPFKPKEEDVHANKGQLFHTSQVLHGGIVKYLGANPRLLFGVL